MNQREDVKSFCSKILLFDESPQKSKNRNRFFLKNMAEISGTGIDISGGFISSDFNNELLFPKSIDIFDEMRKSDATVAAGLSACKTPILSASYDVQAASEDERDQEMAEKIRFCFGIDRPAYSPFISWSSFLQHILLMYDFGFMYFEKVFGRFEDMIIYKKLAPRFPSSIQRFTTEEGNPGIEQMATKDPFTRKEKLQIFSIPQQKLFHIAYQQEGDDLVGISLLRAAYKHWFMKDNAYKIQMIGMERFGNGIPTAQRTEKGIPTNEEKEATKATLQNIRANSLSFIDSPFGTEFKILTPEGTLPDINKPIQHHDEEIAIALQSKFLTTGRNYGSFGQSQNETNFLFNALKGNIDFILERINRGLVKEIIDINFDNVEQYPRIIVSEIGQIDMNAFSASLQRLAQSGMDFTDPPTQNMIRKNMGLPTIDEDELRARQEQRKAQAEAAQKQMEQAKTEENIADAKEEDIEEEEEVEDETMKQKDSKAVKLGIRGDERAFVAAISANEKAIKADFAKVKKDFKATEDKLKKFIKNQYKKAKTTTRGGQEVLQQDGNFQILLDINAKVNKEYKRLQEKYGKKHAQKIVNQAHARGVKGAKKLKGNVAWSNRGYIFNIGKVFDRAPTNIVEKVNDHFGTFAIAAVAISQIDNIVKKAVNKNDLKLSYETYPRSAFKQAVFEDNPQTEDFKMIVPTGIVDQFSIERPEGFTMKHVFQIGTMAFWAGLRDDENGNPLIFPIHPNSQDYYMPIPQEQAEEQNELSKEQRKRINSLSALYENIKIAIDKKDRKSLRSNILTLHNFHKKRFFKNGMMWNAPTTKTQRDAIDEYVESVFDI